MEWIVDFVGSVAKEWFQWFQWFQLPQWLNWAIEVKLWWPVAAVALWLIAKYIAPKKHVDGSELFLVDADIDQSQALVSKLFRESNGAFSKPSKIVSQIRNAPKNQPLKVVINTNGGQVPHCEKILKALLAHPLGYIAYIRQESFSAGALIALGARQIVMADNSYLGKIDPQISDGMSSRSLVWYTRLTNVDSRNEMQVFEAQAAINHLKYLLSLIFVETNEANDANDLSVSERLKKITDAMVYSQFPHYKLFDRKQCKEIIGSRVRTPLDHEMKYFE